MTDQVFGRSSSVLNLVFKNNKSVKVWYGVEVIGFHFCGGGLSYRDINRLSREKLRDFQGKGAVAISQRQSHVFIMCADMKLTNI